MVLSSLVRLLVRDYWILKCVFVHRVCIEGNIIFVDPGFHGLRRSFHIVIKVVLPVTCGRNKRSFSCLRSLSSRVPCVLDFLWLELKLVLSELTDVILRPKSSFLVSVELLSFGMGLLH
jgi:hypothetical protein